MANAEERMKILKMIEDGKVTAEDGAKLLAALSEGRRGAGVANASRPPGAGRWLRIRVTDIASGRSKASVQIPLGLIDAGMKIGAHFAPEVGRLERFLDEHHDLVEIERLVQIVIRAVLHRFDGVLDRGERGHQHHWRVRRDLLDSAQQRQAIAVRQPIVEQHEIDAGLNVLERRRARTRFDNRVPLAAQAFAQRPANKFFVVNDE